MKNKLIVQSNLVTFGRYKFSSWQINCLVNIVDKLQPVMSKDIDWLLADFDVFNDYLQLSKKDKTFQVRLNIKDIERHRHKVEVLNEIKRLYKKDINYTFTNEDGKVYNRTCHLIESMDVNDEFTEVILGIPVSALRWILYYGKGIGGTFFDKKSVLALKGTYAKRIFQILSGKYNSKNKEFESSIKVLMEDFMTPNYSVQDFERKVLLPAFYELASNTECRLAFKYRLVTRGDYQGKGRRPIDTVIFKIYDKEKLDWLQMFELDEWSNRVNSCIKE